MSHFYGVVEGSARTPATRRGTKSSGLKTTAASWEGSVVVRIWRNLYTDSDWATVELQPWHGAGTTRLLWRGPVSGEEEKES